MYEYKGKIKPEFIQKAKDAFENYKADKEFLVKRVKSNISIYQQEYARMYDPKTNKTYPKSGFILNAVENKQADFADNFPEANMLAREPSDEETAKTLSQIIPTILDICDFKKIYKEHSRQKIKKGTGIYGVFYNNDAEEVEVSEIDFMNVYVDMSEKDIQNSEFLFITAYISNEKLKQMYPNCRELFVGDATKDKYSGKDGMQNTMKDKSEIIDCYYKKTDGTLQLMKFCKGNVIEATEDTEGYEKGLYAHGKYPVVFDPMFPDDDAPFGFGIIDVAKNPQLYIDRLDGAILKNSLRAGNPKTLIKRNTGININDYADGEKELIEVATLDENTIKSLEIPPLPAQVVNYRDKKIMELKESVGNRDFQQGGTANGVTSGSAIQMLQEAGDKLSRSQIDDTYDGFRNMLILVIELMREFYTQEKIYRITNDMGRSEYKSFSNEMLFRDEPVRDAFGFEIGTRMKKVEFDISIVPQRKNVYKRETNNQTVTQLYQMGLFNPQNIPVSIMVLKAMSFDGRDGLIQGLQDMQEEIQRSQAEAQMQAQMQAMGVPQGGAMPPEGEVIY